MTLESRLFSSSLRLGTYYVMVQLLTGKGPYIKTHFGQSLGISPKMAMTTDTHWLTFQELAVFGKSLSNPELFVLNLLIHHNGPPSFAKEFVETLAASHPKL